MVEGSSSTRRLRCFSRSHVIFGGRPEHGGSTKPWPPWLAHRWPPWRSAEEVKERVAETVCRRCPCTTWRTAWARWKTRASLVYLMKVSQVGSASWGTWSVRVRI
jgi:hypothetical protein